MNEIRNHSHYYVPPPSSYPVAINLGLFMLTLGFVLRINSLASGIVPMLAGTAIILSAAFGWLRKIMGEDDRGNYHPWEDRSFRIGMAYFIFAEVAFVGAFLMALMYVRIYALPALASMDPHFTLWPGFRGAWPSGGPKSQAFTPFGPWGLPAIKTVLVLASAVSLALTRKALLAGKRSRMILGLTIAIVLGLAFLVLQAMEYRHAAGLGVTLATGVYGTNFYALTALHGAHLLIGIVMLAVLRLRAFYGHLKPESHVGLDFVSWYWNFTVVIPGLLVFIYFFWL